MVKVKCAYGNEYVYALAHLCSRHSRLTFTLGSTSEKNLHKILLL